MRITHYGFAIAMGCSTNGLESNGAFKVDVLFSEKDESSLSTFLLCGISSKGDESYNVGLLKWTLCCTNGLKSNRAFKADGLFSEEEESSLSKFLLCDIRCSAGESRNAGLLRSMLCRTNYLGSNKTFKADVVYGEEETSVTTFPLGQPLSRRVGSQGAMSSSPLHRYS